MANVTFQMPMHVKRAFLETYADENKSLVMMRLVKEAIEREQRRRRRREKLESVLGFMRIERTG